MELVKMKVNKIIENSRLRDWWFSFIPQIAGMVYFCMLSRNCRLNWDLGSTLLLFLIACTGIAVVGYFINEAFDMRDDQRSGHSNQHLNMSVGIRLLWACFAITVAVAPWFFLQINPGLIFLLILELTLFMVYSGPPLRLKRIWWAAVIVDSLYAYALPLCVVYFTFTTLESLNIEFLLVLVALFLVGVRNIVVHQIHDMNYDKLAGITTLPIRIGIKNSVKLLITVLVAEITFYGLFLLHFSIQKGTTIVVVLYFLFTAAKGIYFHVRRRSIVRIVLSTSYTDLFYQAIFPVLCLVLLCTIDRNWWIVAVLHVVIFWRSEFTNLIRTFFLGVRLTVGRFVNFSIYYLFLSVGVDLIKEKKSALTYLKYRISRHRN